MKRYIVLIFILVAGLFLGIRACTSNSSDRKLFYIGRDPTWAPDGFLGKESNMIGFTTELMTEIAKRENMQFEFVESGSHEILPKLDRGDVDGIFSTMASDVVNDEKYLFSDIFYYLGPVLIVRTDSKVKDLSELNGKIVAVQAGALQAYQIYEFPNLIIIPYENISKAFDDLEKNYIDGVILDFLRASAFVQSYYGQELKIATPPLTDRGWRLVTLNNKRSNSHLIDAFNEGLKKMKEDGAYEKLILKWDLFPQKKAN